MEDKILIQETGEATKNNMLAPDLFSLLEFFLLLLMKGLLVKQDRVGFIFN